MKNLINSLVGICIILSACKYNEPKQITKNVYVDDNKEVQESVIKTIEGLKIEPKIYTISASESSKIELLNGGSIVFPEDAFIDEHGKLVEGKVEIEWQEFHSLTDIILSGIPMKYDSLDVNYDFVSGGMFTIKAKQGTSNLDLAEGKKAMVNLISINEDPNFNFYTMNESNGVWKYETTKNGTFLSSKQDVEKKIKKTELLDVKIDISEFPELKEKQIVAWKLNSKLDEKNKTILKMVSSNAQLEKVEDNYAITFDGKYGKIKVRVEPYTLQEALLQKEVLKTKMDRDFSELMVFQDNVQKGKIVRSIEIPNMGTYNWDKVLKRENEQIVKSQFNFNKDVNPSFISLYFISPQENVAIKCSNSDQFIKFDSKKPNFLVAIMPDNSISVADYGEFKKAHNQTQYTFNFKELHQTVKSPQELGKILQTFVKEET